MCIGLARFVFLHAKIPKQVNLDLLSIFSSTLVFVVFLIGSINVEDFDISGGKKIGEMFL